MVEPVRLIQYSAGAELIVQSVHKEGESVRLVLHTAESGVRSDPATSLTVQWPTALSPEFSERGMVEALVLQFVDVM
jgi:hypothetical protein